MLPWEPSTLVSIIQKNVFYSWDRNWCLRHRILRHCSEDWTKLYAKGATEGGTWEVGTVDGSGDDDEASIAVLLWP